MADLEIKDTGAVTFDGTIVGEFDTAENRLVIDMGWARLAGLKLSVLGDSKVDRRRVLFARPDDRKRLERGDQSTLDEHLKETGDG